MIARVGHSVRGLVKEHLGPFVARRQPRRVDLPPERWGLSIGSNGNLWSGEVDLLELARRVGTPLHVVNAELLERNAIRALSPLAAGHGCDVFYSYKTNPVPGVLRRLHAHGIGAEVISPYELWLAMRIGVPPTRIIYNGPAKSADSIREAVRAGIHLVNANSVGDAMRIASLAAEEGRTVRLGLRVSLPGMWGGQFGIDTSSPQLTDAVRRAVADPWVDLVGLHLHRGLTIRDEATLTAYVRAALAQCDDLRSTTGWHPEILDVGGSLACPTVAPISNQQFRLNRALGTDVLAPDPSSCVALDDASALVASLVGEHFQGAGVAVPDAILEPGRALTGDSQFLLTTVLDVKTDGSLAHAVLDAGVNIAEPVTSEFHQLFSVTAPSAVADHAYRLVGPICTPADVLYQHWRLPPLTDGDVLAIMDSGAYFVPFSTAFSFPRPAVVMQDGSTISEICRRESFEDLVHRDIVG